jgi:hypothetical protein
MGEVLEAEEAALEALRHARSSSLRGYAALLLAAAGLVTAVGAVFKPEEGARAGYLELTKSILETQAEVRQQHDDLERLRQYVEGYTREHEVLTVPVQPADAGVPQSALPPPSIVRAFAAPSAVPPPPIAPLRPQAAPRRFDSL